MSESFTSLPGIISFTTGASDVLTRIDFPNYCRRARITFTTNAGKVTTDGTDGAAIGGTAYWSAPADTEVSVFVDQDPMVAQKGPRSIFVTSATAGTTVTVICEAASTTLPTITGGGGAGGGGAATKITFDQEFPIAPATTDLQFRWNAPEAGDILAIYVWADDTVPTTAGTYTISAATGGSAIFSNFDLTSLSLATQTSVGTLTNATLASGDEVEFTVASNNADLTGAGMRCQLIFQAASTSTPVDGATSIAQADVPVAPSASIEVRFTVPVASTILAAKVIADDTIPSSAAGTYTVAVAKDPAGTNVNLLNAATQDLDGTLTLGSPLNLSLTSTSADLDVAANNTIQFQFVSDNADLLGAGLRCMLVTQAESTAVAVEATHIAQRGVTISPATTIDIRFTIPIAATILSIGVIADDTQPASAAGTYTLAAVKDPSGTNTNLLNAATYDLDGTLTVGTLANPTLTGTTADLDVTADTTVQLSFASDNADLVGAGLRCVVVYRGT